MRTAQEIFEEATLKGLSKFQGTRTDIVFDAINIARKEAIEECTKVHLLKFGDKRVVAIKQSILLLINELQ